MIGTIAVSELGGPIQPSASGPSQPSAPMIQTSEKTRPTSVSSRSDSVLKKSTISAAISSRATPTSCPIPVSMASEYSSSITMVERLLTRRGPAEPVANSSIVLSTSWTLVSPVSVRRMLAMVMVVPSVSLPPIAASAPPISGTPRRESISVWVADAASTPPRASITSVGAMIGSAGASSSATPGLARMLSRRASICASPPGVSASPRNTSVTTLTSPDSPKNSSSSSTAVAMALPGGRNATEAPSTGGRRRVAPAASTTVTSRRTMMVMYGRAVTSRLNRSSGRLMARHCTFRASAL